jgi:hypothetical protein
VTFGFRFTALALLLAMLAGPISALGASATAEPCIAPQHDCDDAPTIIECCCEDASGSGPATPAEQRVTVTAAAASMAPAVYSAVSALRVQRPVEHVTTSSPRTCLLDLPTLFATLLI